MKLCSVEVRNWACIESLSLAGLADGVVVLHGPNRTGKSSLVQAIRSCLFDHDHDSQKAGILDIIPRRTKAAPFVAVEFDHAGQRYRMQKTFARTKEGQAVLEQERAGQWSVLVRGKDANSRVRAILGVDTSEAGVFQLLWLGQRDFELPAPRDVDASLAKALEEVLGTLITGRDIDFKNRLDRANERWFTVKTMKDRKESPVGRLADDLEQARQHLDEVNRQWNAAEATLRQYEEAIARQPELARNLEDAAKELERVQKECEGVRHRAAVHGVAVESQTQCERLLKQAEDRLRTFDETGRALELTGRELANLELSACSAQEAREQADQAVAVAKQAESQAETNLAAHRQGRPALEDRQRLATIRLEQQAVEDKLLQVEKLDAQRQGLEQKLVGPAALSELQIRELRQKRERAAALRHQLEAGEIHVTIHARAPVNIAMAGDGAAAESVSLDGAQEAHWLVRQRAEIQVGEIASIRIGRGEDDRNLETVARDLAELQRSLAETLSAAGVDPSDPAAIDQLVARRLEREEQARQLKSVRDDIVRTAPDGIPALRAQIEQKRVDRQVILTRRPELHDWNPAQADVDRARTEFDAIETSLQSKVADGKKNLALLTEASRSAAQRESDVRTQIVGLEASIRNLQDRLGQHDRATLAEECETARTRLADARQKVQESTLTEAEQALETQYQGIQSAHAIRASRVRENEDALLRLRTELAGAEGLHQKRIQAEQVVNDRQRELERESLYAAAHKHLKELFETVRQEQVRRTVGPINDRVMHWARQLGLNEYGGLSFDGQLMPGGLVPAHAGEDEAVALERESYGTLEQLSLLIRLAVGGLLARTEPAVAILDDPLAHADPLKHRKMLDLLARAASGEPNGPHPTGPLQLIILTCHADRFDYLKDAQQIDLARLITRGG